jgi:photosystem II stability/assembly factor-like uncharacterized protein
MHHRVIFYFLLLFFCFHCEFSIAQTPLDPDHWKELKFRNIGPAGMSGRITAIDVDPTDDNRIFLGSASGGVWLSQNGGISFTPIFDEQSSLAIGAIKICPKNPSQIWVGTGEGNPRNSLNTGNGIHKSLDGGKTWKCMGLEKTKTIHRIIIHKDNPDIVFAAALGSPWGPNDERGVFKTTDGGKTWKKILYVNATTGAADMVADPTNPEKIIVSMWEHERKPWTFISGGPGSGIYMTFDGGDTWKKLSSEDGIPKGKLGRVGLAIAPSAPNIIYSLIEAKENGLYKSEDGGLKWKLVQNKDIGNRPFYYSEIYVDPKNENRLYNVFTYLTRSDDGGKSFYNIADYGNAVHPDHHALWIHPQNSEYIIDGNDGGAAISRDMGKSWHFISNLPVGQFYHVNVDKDKPYNVYGGMQDNGSWVGPSAVLKPGGIRNTDFQELYFGDGFDVVPQPGNSRFGYAMSQGGNVAFYDRQTGQNRFVKPNHPEGVTLRYNWNAAIAQHPHDSCSLYFGSQFVHFSKDCGRSWKLISPDLTTNDTTKQDQTKTGGLTLDVTGAETHTTILCIAPSPLDDQIIWVGTDDGNIQLTMDGGKSWTNLNSRIKGLPANAWVPQIEVSSRYKGEAWVVVNNYRQNDYSAYAYHTTDFGKNWRRIADDNQIKGFVVSMVHDPIAPSLWFLGTDVGLYVSLDEGKNWQHWIHDFPQVQVSDMKIQQDENDLVVATFGRAIWILDNIVPLRELANKTFTTSDSLHLFGCPPVFDWFYRSYDGVRFFAQGDFSGANESKGQATMYLWTPPQTKNKEDGEEKKEKPKDKEAKIAVRWINEKGDTIRRTTVKPIGGLQKIYWGLNEDGFRGPSRREVQKEDDAPGGASVLPGKYKCVVTYKSKIDSTWLDVKPDPRIAFDAQKAEAKYRMEKDFESTVKKAAISFEWLKDCRKHLKSLETIKGFQVDSTKKEIEKWQKSIGGKLDTLESLYMLPENTKGIAFDDDKVTSKIQTAQAYVNTSDGGVTNNIEWAIKEAVQAVESAETAIISFKKDTWQPYQEMLSGLTINLFPDSVKKE